MPAFPGDLLAVQPVLPGRRTGRGRRRRESHNPKNQSATDSEGHRQDREEPDPLNSRLAAGLIAAHKFHKNRRDRTPRLFGRQLVLAAALARAFPRGVSVGGLDASTWGVAVTRNAPAAVHGATADYGARSLCCMSETGDFYLCEQCRQRIDPNDESTVTGVEMSRPRTMGGDDNDWIEGLNGYFHSNCTALFGRVVGGRKWVRAET